MTSHLYRITNGSKKIKRIETRSARFITFSWPIITERNPNDLLRRLFHCVMRIHIIKIEANHARHSKSYGKMAANSCMTLPKKKRVKAVTTRVMRWGILSTKRSLRGASILGGTFKTGSDFFNFL